MTRQQQRTELLHAVLKNFDDDVVRLLADVRHYLDDQQLEWRTYDQLADELYRGEVADDDAEARERQEQNL